MKWMQSIAVGSAAKRVPRKFSGESGAELPHAKKRDSSLGSIPKIRVLLVEDNLDLRQAIREVFSLNGFETDTSCRGDAAIEMVYKRRYDVLVSDVRLPGLSGITLARSLRSISGTTRVILITAFPEWSVFKEAKAAGVDEVVEKPFELQALADRVACFGRSGPGK